MRHAGDTADTDGIDGSEDNAGAVLGPDSYGFFGERSKNRLDLPCTVTVREEGGRGGRCSEFLLSLGIELESGVHAMAADTDGIDGSEDNAGAFMTPDSVDRAGNKGLDAKALLAKHDSYGFFSALGDLLVCSARRHHRPYTSPGTMPIVPSARGER
jgi:glycerate-2-kinase